MIIRNFWITADIDGRATSLEGGPKSKDGGFDMTIYIRDEGSSREGVTIKGRCFDGKLRLIIDSANNNTQIVECER